jgi:hypothetical protein
MVMSIDLLIHTLFILFLLSYYYYYRRFFMGAYVLRIFFPSVQRNVTELLSNLLSLVSLQ